MRRVADAIFERLKDEVSCVYFMPGGSGMFLVDALGLSGLHRVSCLHEQGAGFAAIGQAMIEGLGVCLMSAGPSATNAITACAAAWTDSIPVLFISGQARLDTLIGDSGLRTHGAQELDIIPMVKPITKFAHQPTRPDDCLGALNQMVETCKSGRPGPCWLSIPQDVSGAEI
jgi:acetolactate synthase-1/2/3 large subunit